MRATAPPSRGRQGSTANVLGSGMAIISLSSILAKPWMDDPSNPCPSTRESSSSSTVMAKLFRKPRISVNQKRMNLTSCSFALLSTYCTCSGWLAMVLLLVC